MEMKSDKSDPERVLSVCQHPNGDRLHTPGAEARCVQECDCTPRTYVAVDALLSEHGIEPLRAKLEEFLRAPAWASWAEDPDGGYYSAALHHAELCVKAAVTALTGKES
jgi:hypothetical protein